MKIAVANLPRWILVVTCVAIAGCGEPVFYRYRYIALRDVSGIEVVQEARAELDNLVSGPVFPIEYTVTRQQYSLSIRIDPKSFVTGATVELRESRKFRLVPRPRRGSRPERPRSCGAYDMVTPTANRFEFFWNMCGESVDPSEMVIAFDVVAQNGTVFEESLAFTLEKDGFYWIWESY